MLLAHAVEAKLKRSLLGLKGRYAIRVVSAGSGDAEKHRCVFVGYGSLRVSLGAAASPAGYRLSH